MRLRVRSSRARDRFRRRAGSPRRWAGCAARCRAGRSAPAGSTARAPPRRRAARGATRRTRTTTTSPAVASSSAGGRPSYDRSSSFMRSNGASRPERWLPGTTAVGPSARVQSCSIDVRADREHRIRDAVVPRHALGPRDVRPGVAVPGPPAKSGGLRHAVFAITWQSSPSSGSIDREDRAGARPRPGTRRCG